MKAKDHLWTSVLAGSCLYIINGSMLSIIGALAGGFLIDADHVLDQLWSIRQGSPHMRKNTGTTVAKHKFAYFYSRFIKRRKLVRLPLIFHGYEYAILLSFLLLKIQTPFFTGFVVGYCLHLVLDLYRHFHELNSPLFYSIIYRSVFGFKRERLVKAEYL